jgi:hypothetical protein
LETLSGVYLEGHSLGLHGRSPGPDLNPGSPKCEAPVPNTRPRCSALTPNSVCFSELFNDAAVTEGITLCHVTWKTNSLLRLDLKCIRSTYEAKVVTPQCF